MSGFVNPRLPLARLRDAYLRTGRIVIPNWLVPEIASEIHACLRDHTPWDLAYLGAGGEVMIGAEQLRNGEARLRAQAATLARASATPFQFLYDTFQMVDAYIEGRCEALLLHRVLEVFNSPAYLNLMRELTAEPGITRIHAQATCYRAGHFLSLHNDRIDTQQRRVAYVLGFTPRWDASWGGLLHFVADDKHTEIDRMTPGFNTLTLFRVPQWHHVSEVLPAAEELRYSISGWLRDK